MSLSMLATYMALLRPYCQGGEWAGEEAPTELECLSEAQHMNASELAAATAVMRDTDYELFRRHRKPR